MSVQRLTHIGLCVSDLDRSRAFYTTVLGFAEVGGLRISGATVDSLLGLTDADVDARYVERDGFRLELIQFRSPGHRGEAQARPMNLLGLTHLSLRVADLDATIARISEAGGAVLPESRGAHPERGTRFVMAIDPDGTRLELIEAPGDPSRIPQFPRPE